MSKILHLKADKPNCNKMLAQHTEANPPEIDPLIIFYDKTISFFNSHPPGKLAKNVYKLIFALMEHQTNHEQRVSIASYILEVQQLLQLLEDADRLQQTGELCSQPFLETAVDFIYDNCPVTLSYNLCLIIIDFMRYELQIGYPTFINEFFPDFIALLEWLNVGASLIKLDARKRRLE